VVPGVLLGGICVRRGTRKGDRVVPVPTRCNVSTPWYPARSHPDEPGPVRVPPVPSVPPGIGAAMVGHKKSGPGRRRARPPQECWPLLQPAPPESCGTPWNRSARNSHRNWLLVRVSGSAPGSRHHACSSRGRVSSIPPWRKGRNRHASQRVPRYIRRHQAPSCGLLHVLVPSALDFHRTLT
jgi:hypothetical protein